MYRTEKALWLALLWLATAGAAEWTVEQWEQTVYCRFTFEVPQAAEGMIRLTAVDEYEAFFNGELLGGDDDWTTMDEYPVSLRRRSNHLAVRVRNRGRGEGSGLLVEVTDGERAWVSTTSDLNTIWRWTGERQETDDWLTADVSRSVGWAPVQRGLMALERIAAWPDTLGAEVVAGFPGGVDVGGLAGGLTLRRVWGENLALRQRTNRTEVFDGRPNTSWNVDPVELNSVARIDLLRRRLLSEVRVLTGGKDPADFAENSLRGYAVQVSDDGFQWNEVGVRHGIAQFEWTAIRFEPILARFLQVVIAEVDPVQRAKVAEIQVYGEGVAPEGTFVSEPLDLGRAGVRKNFGAVRWEGEVPDGVGLALQFRSSDEPDTLWSPWSEPTAEGALRVPEPRIWLQYRVQLSTRFEDVLPTLRRLHIGFGEETPVSRARGWVVPSQAVLGRDTVFTYTLELDFEEGDLGVERVRINTPSRARVEVVETPAGVEVVEQVAYGDGLELTLAPVWQQSGRLAVRFGARLLTSEFEFTSRLWSEGAAVSLEAEEERQVDPASGQERSWRVRATAIEGALLSGVRVQPPTFSPNGDGVNDGTVVEFALSRVSAPQRLDVEIYDVGGRRVRRLEVGLLSGGEYVRPLGGGDMRSSPGYWDGRDDEGALVPPGVYVVQVRARLEREEVSRVSTVGVVY